MLASYQYNIVKLFLQELDTAQILQMTIYTVPVNINK